MLHKKLFTHFEQQKLGNTSKVPMQETIMQPMFWSPEIRSSDVTMHGQSMECE